MSGRIPPAAQRPWSPLSEVARLLQTGRTIEDPYDRLVWIAVVRSRACDGNARIPLKNSAIDCGRCSVVIH
jgi:hypothetical protein